MISISYHRNAQCIGFALLCATTANAGPRVSTDYSVPTESLDGAGQHSTSASYSNDGSVGGITGISTVDSPAETAKAGYLGQLTETTALRLAATQTTVNEAASCQLSAAQLHDDLTTSAVPAGNITWSVQSGPLTGVDTNGLATAATVYQDTAASAKGDYAGATSTLDLIVLDTIPDNFGTYAGDGLTDDWQFANFGLDNPEAAPLLDPDGDGQNNRFEFISGLDPTDAQSRFFLTIAPIHGLPSQKQVVFNPIVAGRSYTVMTRLDLTAGSWSPLTGGSVSDDGDHRTVTDPAASETKKFYTVIIEKP
jgi:hypothetical protein